MIIMVILGVGCANAQKVSFSDKNRANAEIYRGDIKSPASSFCIKNQRQPSCVALLLSQDNDTIIITKKYCTKYCVE